MVNIRRIWLRGRGWEERRPYDTPRRVGALGANGRTFFARDYSWPVIERKYLDMFERLQAAPPAHSMEPLPGWFARRARAVPPAAETVNALPAGPARPSEGAETTGAGAQANPLESTA